MAISFDTWLQNKGLYYSPDIGPGLLTNGRRTSDLTPTPLTIRTGDMMQQYQKEMFSNALSGYFSGAGAGGGGGGAVGGEGDGNRFAAGLTDYEGRLKALLDNPDSVTQTAGYKFRFNQGQEALNRSLAARGLANSGNRLMELTKYGQDMASQEYDNQANRLNALLGTYAQGYVSDRNNSINLKLGNDRNALTALTAAMRG